MSGFDHLKTAGRDSHDWMFPHSAPSWASNKIPPRRNLDFKEQASRLSFYLAYLMLGSVLLLTREWFFLRTFACSLKWYGMVQNRFMATSAEFEKAARVSALGGSRALLYLHVAQGFVGLMLLTASPQGLNVYCAICLEEGTAEWTRLGWLARVYFMHNLPRGLPWIASEIIFKGQYRPLTVVLLWWRKRTVRWAEYACLLSGVLQSTFHSWCAPRESDFVRFHPQLTQRSRRKHQSCLEVYTVSVPCGF